MLHLEIRKIINIVMGRQEVKKAINLIFLKERVCQKLKLHDNFFNLNIIIYNYYIFKQIKNIVILI
jgi:hypothetical protein